MSSMDFYFQNYPSHVNILLLWIIFNKIIFHCIYFFHPKQVNKIFVLSNIFFHPQTTQLNHDSVVYFISTLNCITESWFRCFVTQWNLDSLVFLLFCLYKKCFISWLNNHIYDGLTSQQYSCRAQCNLNRLFCLCNLDHC